MIGLSYVENVINNNSIMIFFSNSYEYQSRVSILKRHRILNFDDSANSFGAELHQYSNGFLRMSVFDKTTDYPFPLIPYYH